MNVQVSALPVSYDSYLRHGWYLVPINPGSKGPKSANWNQKQNCLTNSNQLPHGYGVGLAHAYSGTCAIDIDDWDVAVTYLQERGIDLQALFDAPDAVTIDSGNKGHGKLLYATPFSLVMNSKKLITTINGSKKNFLDFRCGTANGLTVQDCVPPTIHPTTMQPYQFGGRGHWSRLPVIPTELLTLWQSLLDEDSTKNIKTDTKYNTSWDEIRSALSSINPDCDRDQWVMIAMALHSADPETGYQVFDEWSARGNKYKGTADINSVWRSLSQDGNVTIGSLFHLAYEAGWQRPMPDIAHLFAGITPTDPTNVIDTITLKMQPPVVPIDLFPKVLAQRANEVAVDVGCEPIIPLMAGLAAVCGVVDSRIRLHIGGSFKVPPILWIMTIGDPSVKKSPGANQMFRVLADLEHEDRDKHRVEHLIWEGKQATFAASKKAYLEHCGQASALLDNDTPPGVTPLPEEPKALRLKVTDSTSQKIVHLSQGRPRGFLLHLDEMKNWTDKINTPQSGEDRGCWIQGYESGGYTMDRVGTGTISAENIAVAIYGNLQPRVFEYNLSKMSDDGLLQRFIPITVRSDLSVKPKFTPSYLTSSGDYDELLRKLYALPVQEYSLSPDSFSVYDEFQDWYYNLINAEKMIRSSDTYLTALGKAEGTCARLALIFHLIESPYNQTVSKGAMERATALMRVFIVPSLRHAFNNSSDSLEEWVKDHIIALAGEQATVTLSDVKRSARRQLEGLHLSDHVVDQRLRMALDTIAAGGWLALVEENRKTVLYSINPNLANMYAKQRAEIVKAKKLIKEQIRENALRDRERIR